MQGLSTRFARAEALAEAQGTPLGCWRSVMGRTRPLRGMTQRSSPAEVCGVWFCFGSLMVWACNRLVRLLQL